MSTIHAGTRARTRRTGRAHVRPRSLESHHRRRCTSTRIRRDEGELAADGPIVCRTGAHTGRSPNDKFVVTRAVE